MSVSSSATRDGRVIFSSGDRSFTERDVIDWALLQGELLPAWRESQRVAGCDRLAEEQGLESDSSAIDSASIAFRYAHDLITGEETERWLEERGLTLADFSQYFARKHWGKILSAVPAETPYQKASADKRDRFAIDLVLAGHLDCWAEEYSRRVAARAADENVGPTPEQRADLLARAGVTEETLPQWLADVGRDADWFADVLATEAAYRRQTDSLVTEKDLARELVGLRLLLTRFELETVEVDSRDAAAEVLACVRSDGMEMSEVAQESRYPYHAAEMILEDLPPEQQQRYLSAKAGSLLDPLPRDDAFEVCRVRARIEPSLQDPAIRERIEERIIARHFATLVSRFIDWRLLPPTEK